MRIFILEDNIDRIRLFQKHLTNHELVITSEALEAIKLLEKDLNFDFVFLDHDLGGELFANSEKENTGCTVAKFLRGKDIKGDIVIHSFNSIGARNMQAYLPDAYYVPFSISFLERLGENS